MNDVLAKMVKRDDEWSVETANGIQNDEQRIRV